MIPKITILGTAGDSYLMSKQVRASCGIVLHVDNMQFVLDPGPGSVVNMNKNEINVRETTGVILSNNEIVFSGDANSVVDAMTFGGIDVHGVLIANKASMFGNDEEQPVVLSCTKKRVEKYIVLNPDQRVGINNIEIKAFNSYKRENNDVVENSNSTLYKIITQDFTISYIGLSAYHESIGENLKDTSILILSLTDLEEYSRNDSMNISDIEKIICDVQPNIVILTNFGIKPHKNDVIDIARRIHRNTQIQVISAKDGLNITPTTYVKKSKQTSLSNFKK